MEHATDTERLIRLDERTNTLIGQLSKIEMSQAQGFKDVAAALKEHAAEDDNRFLDVKKEFEAHAKRIKVLEDWRLYLLGGMALGGLLMGFVMWAFTIWNPAGVIVERTVTTETKTVAPDTPKRPAE